MVGKRQHHQRMATTAADAFSDLCRLASKCLPGCGAVVGAQASLCGRCGSLGASGVRRCQNETGCETGALRAGSARGARGGAVKRTINPIRRTFWEKMLLQIESKPAPCNLPAFPLLRVSVTLTPCYLVRLTVTHAQIPQRRRGQVRVRLQVRCLVTSGPGRQSR